MLFNDFVHKYNLKNKAASNIKRRQFVSSLALNDVGIYLRDDPFSTDIGILNFHPFQSTHWVLFIREWHFDSYGCSPPQKLSKFIIDLYGYCLYSEYKIQGLTRKREILFVQVIGYKYFISQKS